MQPCLNLVTLGVDDLPRATAFYRDGLGWPLSSASQESVSFFRNAGAVLALYPRTLLAEDALVSPDGSGFGGIALAWNVPERADVDEVLRLAEIAGATILKPAQDAFWGGYHGYFADLDGYPWEIAWNPFFPLRQDGSVQIPT